MEKGWTPSPNSVFIIAEAGVNHNGDMALGRQLVDVALDAGADAVKFQSFVADRLATANSPKAAYQLETTNSVESQREMLRRIELSAEGHYELADYCKTKGILFISTPFDEEGADFLDELGVPMFKTPSPEITNLPFLAHVASKGKPMIVSTGTANLGETEAAVRAIEEAGNQELVLLHCVSSYPANPADVNLRAMATMRKAFGVPIGYSDHTQGLEVALAATALGACVIEKHFTLDRTLPGPDHRASLEPAELVSLVKSIRTVESSLGNGRKQPAMCEEDSAKNMRKSLVAAKDISSGSALDFEMVTARRPGTGLSPAMRPYVMGKRARQDIREGVLLTLEMFE